MTSFYGYDDKDRLQELPCDPRPLAKRDWRTSMTSKATNAVITESFDELEAQYQAAIEQDRKVREVVLVGVVLFGIACMTTYLAYVGTLPWLGCFFVCGLLILTEVCMYNQATASEN